MKIMVWNAQRGGMRSVVEAYGRDGFLEKENVTLIAAYADGSFISRQLLLIRGLFTYVFYLLTRRVELVHIHAAMRGSFWRKGIFASFARIYGIPVILHLHGSEFKPFYQSQRPIIQRLIRGHLQKASRIIVLSESWQEFVSTIAPTANVLVVPNYVVVSPLVDESARQRGNILFLGLIGPRKGIFDLIPAFAAIAPAHPEARLLIGGNGQTEEAAGLIKSLDIGSQASLAGWVAGAAKDELLRTSSIYILPSYNEGLPMSVLEAMAAGLAVITTRVGGIPELITSGVDGLLVEAGDRAAISNAMSDLLTDDALRRRLADAGRRRVEKYYSDRAVLPQLHRLYENVLLDR